MHRSQRHAYLLIAALLLFPVASFSAQPAIQDKSQTKVESRIDAVFREYDSKRTPGCAVAVVRGGKVIFAKGYGMANLEYGIPITPDTVFHVASVSKQFTAFGIMLLADKGKLSLDDDIRKHLPDVPNFGKKITIRHLIHHTSGLRDQWSLLTMAGWRMDDVITTEHILKLVRKQRELNFAPGAEFTYCNTGYTLLAEIIRRVSGDPFPKFVQKRVFKPLKMTSTLVYDDHERVVKNRAYSYKLVRAGGSDPNRYKKAVLNYANAGATSLFTSATDLAPWLTNLNTFELGGKKVQGRMLKRGKLNNGTSLSYGGGLFIDEFRGVRRIGHGGGDAGFRTYVGTFPEHDLGVIVLSNDRACNPADKAMKLAAIYLGDHFKKVQSAKQKKTSKKKNPRFVKVGHKALDALSGVYQTSRAIIIIRRDGDRMLIQAYSPSRFRLGRKIAMYTASELEIVSSTGNTVFTFSKDKKGVVTHFKLKTRTSEFTGKRLESKPPDLDSKQLAAYAGTYESPELSTQYTLIVKKGMLMARHPRLNTAKLYPIMSDQSFCAGPLRLVRFERDKGGRITGFRATTGRVRNLLFIRKK